MRKPNENQRKNKQNSRCDFYEENENMHKLFYNLLLLSFNLQILRMPLGHFDYA